MTSTTTPSNSGLGKGNWSEQKTQLKAKFPTLTDADLTYEAGKMDAMFTKLEKKTGKTKEELTLMLEKKS